MTLTTAHRVIACLTLAALTLTGCTGANVETKTEADATTLVQQRAEQIATLIGSPLEEPATNAAGCTGKLGETSDNVFSVQGAYQIPVPTEQQLTTLARLRDAWKANGYTITDDRTVGTTEGVLAAKTRDGYDMSVESTRPPTAFALLIHSPCFRFPTRR